jgi:hypothetical protein
MYYFKKSYQETDSKINFFRRNVEERLTNKITTI